MRVLRFMALAGLALLVNGAAASAADLPTKARVAPLPVQTYTGSGIYFGASAGMMFGRQQIEFVTLPGVSNGDIFPAGPLVGATLGWGTSLGGAWAGFEADFDYQFNNVSSPCLLGRCEVKSSFMFDQGLVFGVPMSSLTGVAPNVQPVINPSQWPIPITVPGSFSAAAIMPAVKAGIAEKQISVCADPTGGLGVSTNVCGQQWIYGPLVGAQLRWILTPNWVSTLEYDHVWFNKSFTPLNSVTIFPTQFDTKQVDVFKLKFLYSL